MRAPPGLREEPGIPLSHYDPKRIFFYAFCLIDGILAS